MKNKILTILFIGLLIFSCLSLSSANVVKCPICGGTGIIDCPKCGGTGTIETQGGTSCVHCSGTGTLQPTVQKTGMQVEQRDGATYVMGTFHNKETFDVSGTVTASLSGHSNSTEVTFPAEEDTAVTIQINYLGSYPSAIQMIQHTTISLGGIESITCPYCDGTGTIADSTTCTKCQGTGTIDCTTCDGTGYVDEALVAQSAGFPLVAIEAVVAVVAVAGGGVGAFVVLKKKRVSEQSLRRLSPRQFSDWVLGRLDGKAPSSRDTAMGIDGYTRGGQPVLIKQSDDVGMTVIDSFAASLARNKARNGVIVAYSFGSDAVRGKVRAQLNYKLQIEMLTIKELIDSKRTL